MRIIIGIVIFFLTFSLTSNASSQTLTISRSRAHEAKSGPFIPLVVSFFTQDKATKEKPVDLFCIVDISGSMYGTPINLVKESLKYLVNLMNETDRFALITFSSYANIGISLTQMTEGNKATILRYIDNLVASGGTNIYSGLQLALSLLTQSYSSGDRVASMILLSDGQDSNFDMADDMFKELLEREKKEDYVFTLNSFGFGDYHDYQLMNDIALIRPGSYFYIQKLKDVNDAYLKIYGSLSTVSNVNAQLKIQSKFNIVKVYGIEDMYKANLINGTSSTLSSFETTLIQIIYGKRYEFVLLVDVPKNTPKGTEVLTASMPSLGLNARYLWDEIYSKSAYEEYIRCIVVIIFIEGYESKYSGVTILEEGKEWMKLNYNGTRNWAKEFDGVINDISSSGSYYGGVGLANLLSKITELKTSTTIGIHYDEGNSYQRILIGNSHSLDIINVNYYYFYLKTGSGFLNNRPFSGESTSFIIITDDFTSSDNINIISLSDEMDCYYDTKTITRPQIYVDFGRVAKFIIKKYLSYDFYTPVDGKRDITFNIEFFKIDLYDPSMNIGDILEIKAYIISDDYIDNIVNNEYILSSFVEFKGVFNKNIGKVVIKKDEISYNLDSVHENYLYVVVNINSSNSFNISNNIEGQFIFVPNNYIYSSIPENYKIYSNLETGENNPHLYTLDVGSSKNNSFLIVIINYGAELDFKILQYQNDIDSVIDLYNDYDKINITRKKVNDSLYINVTQKANEPLQKIILSIFSTKNEHISGSDINNLTYTFKYDTYYLERNSVKVIILGFAKYIYIKTSKIVNFFVYFVHIKTKTVYQKIYINTRIRYKKSLRLLQNDEENKATCVLINNTYDNQDKYNCTLDTNGEDIENIELDKNIEIEDDDITPDNEISPIGNKYTNNLQNVGDSDIFEKKKLFILENSTVIVENENKNFKITGYLDNDGFNHNQINLELLLSDNSELKNDNITCNSLNEKDGALTLECNTEKNMTGIINNGFAEFENDNLMVNILDSEKTEQNKLNFGEKEEENEEDEIVSNNTKMYRKAGSTGLSTGGIVAIVIPCVLATIIITAIIIYCNKKQKITSNNVSIENQSSVIEKANYSTNSGNAKY